MGHYLTGLVCENGHPVTGSFERCPELASNYCPECGAATTSRCQASNTPIHGRYEVPGVADLTPYIAPRFCHNCGSPYPCTAAAQQAAKQLAKEFEGLTDEDRESLGNSIDDIVRDTTRTQLASVRFKKLLAKTEKEGANAMKDILIGIASEAAKRLIW